MISGAGPIAETVTVYFLGSNGEVQEQTTDELGYYQFSAAYGELVTLFLGEYNGTYNNATRPHEFRVVDDVPSTWGPVRSGSQINFTALAAARVDFVNVERATLDVAVVGGSSEVAKVDGLVDADNGLFATGQLLEARVDHCGHTTEMRTIEGVATASVPSTGPYDVTLVSGAAASSIPACLALDAADAYNSTSCRVEMPTGAATDRLPCADETLARVRQGLFVAPPERRPFRARILRDRSTPLSARSRGPRTISPGVARLRVRLNVDAGEGTSTSSSTRRAHRR